MSPPMYAEAMAPPAIYSRWWSETESCSGLTGDFHALRWFRAPGAAVRRDGKNLAGYYSSTGYILLAAPYVDADGTVRHEMLHALIRGRGHPRDQFLGKCKDVVDCPTECAADGGPWHAPAAFIPLSVDSLSVSSKAVLLPREADGQRWVALTVTVVNPRPVAIFALPDGAWFSWGVNNGADSWSLSMVDSASLYFDAHQTRTWTHEMRVADSTTDNTISPGLRYIDGAFGQHWTPFTAVSVLP